MFTDTVARQSLVKFQGMFMNRKSFQQLKTKVSIHNRALLKVQLAKIIALIKCLIFFRIEIKIDL